MHVDVMMHLDLGPVDNLLSTIKVKFPIRLAVGCSWAGSSLFYTCCNNCSFVEEIVGVKAKQ
eukprot:scaffold743_cov145-Skeletonema_menzelii.AAC.14